MTDDEITRLFRECYASAEAATQRDAGAKGISENAYAARLAANLTTNCFGALMKRINELENNTVRFAGTYQTSRTYRRGDMATYKGALWHCNRPSTERPGASDDWQLAVKKGEAQ